MKHAFPIRKAAAGELADDQRMHGNLAFFQPSPEFTIAPAEVIDPHGGVYQSQRADLAAGRRRGMAFILGAEPPMRARRRALSRCMISRRPRWSSAVFPVIPVSRRASSRSSSSRSRVVRICAIMHQGCRSDVVGLCFARGSCAKVDLPGRRPWEKGATNESEKPKRRKSAFRRVRSRCPIPRRTSETPTHLFLLVSSRSRIAAPEPSRFPNRISPRSSMRPSYRS